MVLARSLLAARMRALCAALACASFLFACASPTLAASHRAGTLLTKASPTSKGAPPKARKPAKPRSTLQVDAARALLAYEAMQSTYYIPGTDLYTGEPYSFLWPFLQAFGATVSLDEIPHMTRAFTSKYTSETHGRLAGLERYWGPAGQTLPGRPTEEEEEEQAQPEEEGDNFITNMPSFNGNTVPPGGISYYDDNEWVALELVRLYKHTHESQLLQRAEQVMAFVMAAWQANPRLACPGGIPFSDSPDNIDRNTITDAPAAELGVQLYWISHNIAYLRFAEGAYQWVRTCLLEPNGLYADHIRNDGMVVDDLWSYTQGAMIGAGTMLYQATHNGAFLAQARATAKLALAYFTLPRLEGESAFFPAVYFRNLLYLDSMTHDPPGRRLAQAYVDHLWAEQRTSTNLFTFGSPPSSQLLWQAAVAQIYALLSEPPSSYF
jgi:glycosyl hydrolase family 76